MFNKTPVELPKPLTQRGKCQSLLHAIGGGWYMNKLNENILPPKRTETKKKPTRKEDEIKRNLQMENQNSNDCRFRIRWNKLEWVNPRSCNEKNPFFVSSKNYV